MKPLRFGIVGCGGISNLHATCLQHLKNEGVAELVAGAEPNPKRAAEWSAKHGVPVVSSLAELLKRDDVDAVTITTPSGLHGDHTIQIAQAGRHVLCEKPLDVRLAKADEAIAAAKKAGVTLGGIFQQRFPAGPKKVKRAIDAGAFGKIVFVHAETPWYRAQKYYDADAWRGTWDLDGGVLGNQSPHMIDRLIWLGGDIEEVVSATLACGLERKIEAETVAVATLRLKNGALGTLTGTTLAYDGLPQRVLICGTEGSAAFSADDLVYFKTKNPFEDDLPATTVAAGGNQAGEALSLGIQSHLDNIRDFATAVHEKRAPACTAEDGRRVVRALNLIYQAAGVGPFKGGNVK